MARKTIERNIALDDERELYYVTLQWGKNKDGKYDKTTKTAHSNHSGLVFLSSTRQSTILSAAYISRLKIIRKRK